MQVHDPEDGVTWSELDPFSRRKRLSDWECETLVAMGRAALKAARGPAGGK